MDRAVIAGVGMTRFGKHMDTGLKALGREALLLALRDAGIDKNAIEAASSIRMTSVGLVAGGAPARGRI